MNRNMWAPEERDEYDALLAEVVQYSNDTSERLDYFEDALADARQAHRTWARDVERSCIRTGLAAEIKRFQDRHRASISHNGRVLNLPKIQSRTARREDGSIYHERALIDTWTWDDIEAKRAAYVATIAASRDEITYLDKLLALRDRCPGSSGPADAVRLLGLVLDDYLAEPEAVA